MEASGQPRPINEPAPNGSVKSIPPPCGEITAAVCQASKTPIPIFSATLDPPHSHSFDPTQLTNQFGAWSMAATAVNEAMLDEPFLKIVELHPIHNVGTTQHTPISPQHVQQPPPVRQEQWQHLPPNPNSYAAKAAGKSGLRPVLPSLPLVPQLLPVPAPSPSPVVFFPSPTKSTGSSPRMPHDRANGTRHYTAFPNRHVLATRLFGEKAKEELADFFIACLKHVPNFYSRNPQLIGWRLREGPTIEELFVQAFFIFLEDALNKAAANSPIKNGPTTAESPSKDHRSRKTRLMRLRQPSPAPASPKETPSSPKKELPPSPSAVELVSLVPSTSPSTSLKASSASFPCLQDLARPRSTRVPINQEQKCTILRELISIDFSCAPGANNDTYRGAWPLIFRLLSAYKIDHLHEWFMDEVKEAAKNARASFSILIYCMTVPELAKCLDTPDYILQALILGPLRGSTVEQFTSGKDEEFREQARQLVLEAMRWSKDQRLFAQGVFRYAHTTTANHRVLTYQKFNARLVDLLLDLRRDQTASYLVNMGWAKRELRNAADKVYTLKTWQLEQLDDLIHTVLFQRSELKYFVVNNLLRQTHNDDASARRWEQFKPASVSRTRMSRRFDRVSRHTASSDEYLATPEEAEIYVVDTVQQLAFLSRELDETLKADGEGGATTPMVGLDAEWNPYVGKSKASILQVAFQKAVYILDLDTLSHPDSVHRLIAHLNMIFGNERLMKIGFQFNEDLLQIRETVPECSSLYHPENVVCVGKLIAELMQLTARNCPSETDAILGEFFPAIPTAAQEPANAASDGAVIVNDDASNDSLSASKTTDETPSEEPSTSMSIADESGGLPRKRGKLDPATQTMDSVIAKSEKVRNLGLSTLCHRMLGKKLDKAEQCSVWDRRPLRDRQIRYAALDAYCLLQLYAKCEEWAKRIGADLGELCAKQGKIRASFPLFWGRFSEITWK